MDAINFKSLRWSLTLLLMSALLTAAVVVAALQFDRQVAAAHRQAKTQQTETQTRLSRVHEEEREIRAKINRYSELIALGRIAPEQRLEWVEALRQIKEVRRLPGLDYEIAPQRPLDEKNPVSGGYAFLASPMKLEMPLLHENDLLGLLADLSAQVQALVSVKSCTLERIPRPHAERDGAPLLKARCEIDWITLQEKT